MSLLIDKLIRESKQKIKEKEKKDKANKELEKVLGDDLFAALQDSDDHETKVELLLVQIVLELQEIKLK